MSGACHIANPAVTAVTSAATAQMGARSTSTTTSSSGTTQASTVQEPPDLRTSWLHFKVLNLR